MKGECRILTLECGAQRGGRDLLGGVGTVIGSGGLMAESTIKL